MKKDQELYKQASEEFLSLCRFFNKAEAEDHKEEKKDDHIVSSKKKKKETSLNSIVVLLSNSDCLYSPMQTTPLD